MKRVLTAAFVANVKPPKAGQVDIFDASHPGLALRVGYGGRKAWTMLYRKPNEKKISRHALGIWPVLTLAEAREAWREVRKSLLTGIAPAAAVQPEALVAPRVDTFETVCLEWLHRDQDKKGRKAADKVRRTVKANLISAWGNRPVKEITKQDAIKLIEDIADRSPSMARAVFAHGHRAFQWALGRDQVQANPFATIIKNDLLGAAKRRERVLTDAELIDVWNASEKLSGPFAAAFKLLVLTGARRSEIANLRWSEIDGDTIKLPGSRTKNSEAHSIPLSSPARALLDQVKSTSTCSFVFSTDGRRAIAGWDSQKEKLDAASGVSGWVYHDLRRVVSTGMNEAGIEPHIVESVLGHTVKGIAATYNKAKHESAKRIALEAWGAHIMALLHGGKPAKVIPMVRA